MEFWGNLLYPLLFSFLFFPLAFLSSFISRISLLLSLHVLLLASLEKIHIAIFLALVLKTACFVLNEKSFLLRYSYYCCHLFFILAAKYFFFRFSNFFFLNLRCVYFRAIFRSCFCFSRDIFIFPPKAKRKRNSICKLTLLICINFYYFFYGTVILYISLELKFRCWG